MGRTLGIARAARRRLAQASLLGAGAIGASIALMGTSAWLISRASQHPSEASLTLAIVGVQFFGLSRGFFRYGERLVGHDAALRVLADLRVRVYRSARGFGPGRPARLPRGDLVARVVDDVDSLQDVVLRVMQPFAVAVLVGAATSAAMWWILPQAGLILLVALLISATAVPWLTGLLAARAESRQATARGELTAGVVDLIEGAPELVVMGATGRPAGTHRRVGRRSAHDRPARRRHHRHRPGSDHRPGRPGQLGGAHVGVHATHAGSLNGALLAVLALVPLAAFELVSPLPAATQALQRSRVAAGRVFDVMDVSPVVSGPDDPLALATAPTPWRCATCGRLSRGRTCRCFVGSTWSWPPADGSPWSDRAARASRPSPTSSCDSCPPTPGRQPSTACRWSA